MTGATDTQPGTKAAMIRSVLATPHPRLALGTIALRFHVTLADLQVVLNHAGYPNRNAMMRAAEQLEAEDRATPEEIPTVDESTERDDSTSDAPPAQEKTLLHVDVAKIHPDPDNPRTQLTDIEDLADSIAQIGLMQPIVVRRASNGMLFVVAGHRRLAAIKQLRWTKVDVLLDPTIRSDAVLAAMLIENGQRVDLNAIEEARALHRLKAQLSKPETEDSPARACSEPELARHVGRSLNHVNGRLLLLKLSAEDQQAVIEGRFGISAATQKARTDSGRLRNGAVGRPSPAHLSSHHDLADLVRARCTRMKHSAGKGVGVGGVGCGICWESVIRADEREHLQEITSDTHTCPVCGTKDVGTEAQTAGA